MTSALAVAFSAVLVTGPMPVQAAVELKIESWRSDDIDIWNDTILPAFHAKNPDIKVVFAPTPPADYNASLNAKLAGGTAGDLITCRPFDASLELYKQGHLVTVNDIPGLANFDDVAKSAWQTDDGADTYCMPMASVIHGFIYNVEAFEELGVTAPATIPEFMALLKKIEDDGGYVPLSLGTADQWEAATMGFQNVGTQLLERRGWPQEPDRRHREAHRSAVRGGLEAPGRVGALHGPGVQGAEVFRQPEPLHPRSGGDLPGRLLGHRHLQFPGGLQVRRLRATGARGSGRVLHQRPHGHRAGHQRRLPAPEGSQGVPGLDGLGGVRRSLRQLPARISTPTPCPVSSRSPSTR
jgi:hypothetical protein